MWHIEGAEHSLKISINEWNTKVLVEQPRLHGSVKYIRPKISIYFLWLFIIGLETKKIKIYMIRKKLGSIALLIPKHIGWSPTNRQNPLIQQNRRNSWTSNAIWMPFKIQNFHTKMVKYSFYDWKHHLQPLRCGGAMKIFLHRITHWINWFCKRCL